MKPMGSQQKVTELVLKIRALLEELALYANASGYIWMVIKKEGGNIGGCSPNLKPYEAALADEAEKATERPVIVTLEGDPPTQLPKTERVLLALAKTRHVELHPIVAMMIQGLNEINNHKIPRVKALADPRTMPPWFPLSPDAYASRSQKMDLHQLFSVLDSIFNTIRGSVRSIRALHQMLDKAYKSGSCSIGTRAGMDSFFHFLEEEALGASAAAKTDVIADITPGSSVPGYENYLRFGTAPSAFEEWGGLATRGGGESNTSGVPQMLPPPGTFLFPVREYANGGCMLPGMVGEEQRMSFANEAPQAPSGGLLQALDMRYDTSVGSQDLVAMESEMAANQGSAFGRNGGNGFGENGGNGLVGNAGSGFVGNAENDFVQNGGSAFVGNGGDELAGNAGSELETNGGNGLDANLGAPWVVPVEAAAPEPTGAAEPIAAIESVAPIKIAVSITTAAPIDPVAPLETAVPIKAAPETAVTETQTPEKVSEAVETFAAQNGGGDYMWMVTSDEGKVGGLEPYAPAGLDQVENAAQAPLTLPSNPSPAFPKLSEVLRSPQSVSHSDLSHFAVAMMTSLDGGTDKKAPKKRARKDSSQVPPWSPLQPDKYAARVQGLSTEGLFLALDGIFEYVRSQPSLTPKLRDGIEQYFAKSPLVCPLEFRAAVETLVGRIESEAGLQGAPASDSASGRKIVRRKNAPRNKAETGELGVAGLVGGFTDSPSIKVETLDTGVAAGGDEAPVGVAGEEEATGSGRGSGGEESSGHLRVRGKGLSKGVLGSVNGLGPVMGRSDSGKENIERTTVVEGSLESGDIGLNVGVISDVQDVKPLEGPTGPRRKRSRRASESGPTAGDGTEKTVYKPQAQKAQLPYGRMLSLFEAAGLDTSATGPVKG